MLAAIPGDLEPFWDYVFIWSLCSPSMTSGPEAMLWACFFEVIKNLKEVNEGGSGWEGLT